MGIVAFHIRIGSIVALVASRITAVAVAVACSNIFCGLAGVDSPCLAADNLEFC
jgi:hypothetical protein